MTAPVWIAVPPEVHSGLLTSGPGPGSLLASAEAWSSLRLEYDSAANDLADLIRMVHADVWQGPAAEAYAAAHGPYLAWLTQAACDSAAAANEHQIAAAAYARAVAAMPTLAELAANHATHAVLMATNFFGVNTIPIALNEADYARMWVLAAATMDVYHATATAAVAAVPAAHPAPPINSPHASVLGSAARGPSAPPSDPAGQLQWLLQTLTQQYDFLIQWLSDPASTGFTPQMIWNGFAHTAQVLFTQLIPQLLAQPSSSALLVVAVYASMAVIHASQLLILAAPLLVPAAVPVVGLGALSSLSALAEPFILALAPSAPIPLTPAAATVAGPAGVPTSVATTSSPASTPSTTSMTSPTPPPAAAPPPAPSTIANGQPLGPPYLIDPPRAGFGVALPTPTPDHHITNASRPAGLIRAAVSEGATVARRRRRSTIAAPGRGHEYMNVEDDAPPHGHFTTTAESQYAAGDVGFAGVHAKEGNSDAAGLITLRGYVFGSGPTEPMMPSSWNPE